MLQVVHKIAYGVGPEHIVGSGYLFLIVYAQSVVGRSCYQLFSAGRCAQCQLHIRLSCGQPYLAGQYVGQRHCLLAVTYREGIFRTGDDRGGGYAPLAAVVCRGMICAVVKSQRNAASCIGCAMKCQRAVALEHHAALVHCREFQPAVITCYGSSGRFRKQGFTLGIGVYPVRKQVLMVTQRFVEVNKLSACGFCHIHYFLLDLKPPVACAGAEPIMFGREGRQQRYHDSYIRIHLAE